MIEPQVNAALNLWYRNGLSILNKIEDKNWNISIEDLVDFFNKTFYINNIRFYTEDTPKNIRKYIDKATFSEDGIIEIYLRKALVKYFQKLGAKKDYMVRWLDYSRNEFIEEFVEVVSHELLHKKQWELGMSKCFLNTLPEDIGIEEYLSVCIEIQAYAQDAARLFLYSRNYNMKYFYQNLYEIEIENQTIRKKFFKTYYKFLEKMYKGRTGHPPSKLLLLQ